ncbi:D-lactaldehyde dehydrogenase [Agrocybe pediades]|nr:D-lactaldehyde dehydrogenase [Agrocybe pediades]
MPSIESNKSKRVLITGANGYIAAWIVKTLLEQGFTVLGAVRTQEKGDKVVDMFNKYTDRLEIVVVEDMTKDGAFDEAVKRVDAVLHTASPVSSAIEEPEEFNRPALLGTLGLLTSALKHGTNLKRVVMTSSCSTLHRPVNEPTQFNENDWAESFIHYVKSAGKKAPFIAKYLVSKALAERASWEFYQKHKSDIKWDFVTILPPYVMGPPLQDLKDPSNLPASVALFYKAICTEQTLKAVTAEGPFGYVHVTDVATAHVEALKVEKAAGHRIIVAAGGATWQITRDILYRHHPALYKSGVLPRGYPDIANPALFTYDAERSKKTLGITYRTLDQIANDTLGYIIAKNWLKGGQLSAKA